MKGKIPTNICVRCSEALISANQIRKLCFSSEKYLRHLTGEDFLANESMPADYSFIMPEYKFSNSPFPLNVQPIVKMEIIKEEIVNDELECSKGFDLTDSVNFLNPEEPLSMKVKAQTSSNEPKPRQRKTQVNEVNMVQCQKCGKLYQSRYLQKHINSHDKPVVPANLFTYRCDICAYTCNVKAYMTSHMNSQHVVSE